MNKTLINLLQQNRAKRGREKKIPSGTVANEETPQEEQKPDPTRQCNSLAESYRRIMTAAMKRKMVAVPAQIPWIELTEKCGDWAQYNIFDEYICPNSYKKKDILAGDDFFVEFASDQNY